MGHDILSLTTEQLQQDVFLHATSSEDSELFTADQVKEFKANSMSTAVWAWSSTKVRVPIFDSLFWGLDTCPQATGG